MKTMRVYLALGAALLAAPAADAQSLAAPKQFLNVNVGAQPQRRTVATSAGLPVFDETLTLDTSQRVSRGAFFEVSGGRRVWNDITVGAGVSFFNSSGSGATTAVVPSPVFFDRPVTLGIASDDLERTEVGINIRASWFLPVTDKIDISLSAGPSFIRVSQDLVISGAVPAGTQTVNLAVENQHKFGTALNAGFDVNYMFNSRYGVGVFLQYAGGTMSLPSASDVKFGGVQAGAGLRVRM